MAIDPVCKMEVDPKKAAAKSDFEGCTYYFCNINCKKKFDETPKKFLEGPSKDSHCSCCGGH